MLLGVSGMTRELTKSWHQPGMEEISQLIFEVVGQAIVEFIVDAFWRTMPPGGKVVLKVLLCAGFAALLGFLSSIPFPDPFIESEAGRIAYLVIVPVALGEGMAMIGRFMSARGRNRTSLESFGFGWLFAFSFALVRFIATG